MPLRPFGVVQVYSVINGGFRKDRSTAGTGSARGSALGLSAWHRQIDGRPNIQRHPVA